MQDINLSQIEDRLRALGPTTTFHVLLLEDGSMLYSANGVVCNYEQSRNLSSILAHLDKAISNAKANPEELNKLKQELEIIEERRTEVKNKLKELSSGAICGC
jgi:hypothetical protein